MRLTRSQCRETEFVKVMDLQGRVVAEFQLKQGVNDIGLENLPEGMYLLKSGQGNVNKILKTR